jgi:hypothetical protein
LREAGTLHPREIDKLDSSLYAGERIGIRGQRSEIRDQRSEISQPMLLYGRCGKRPFCNVWKTHCAKLSLISRALLQGLRFLTPDL